MKNSQANLAWFKTDIYEQSHRCLILKHVYELVSKI